ncbi:hypothetical protein HanHA300_Chr08g0285781 [Helianthus annuus]|nr:hypothetical protein HanHA300_Chr08g0285781 [Helianthus annuus]
MWKNGQCSGNGRSLVNDLTNAHLPPMEPQMHGDESGDEVVARSRNRDGDGEGKDGGSEVETKTERVKTVAAQGFSGGLRLFPAKMVKTRTLVLFPVN